MIKRKLEWFGFYTYLKNDNKGNHWTECYVLIYALLNGQINKYADKKKNKCQDSLYRIKNQSKN